MCACTNEELKVFVRSRNQPASVFRETVARYVASNGRGVAQVTKRRLIGEEIWWTRKIKNPFPWLSVFRKLAYFLRIFSF